MKNWNSLLLLLAVVSCTSSYCSGSSTKAKTTKLIPQSSLFVIPDSIILDTIAFKDMNDEYNILLYKINENIVQMDVDRKGSYTVIDYIIWDMDKNGKLEAIGVYNVLDQKYDYHLIEEELEANDLLEYLVQLEDIGFPSFYDSSDIPKAIYKSEEHKPILNYYR